MRRGAPPRRYLAAGATRPGDAAWTDVPPDWRARERTVVLGGGQELWAAASRAVLDWEVKTRSGFTVAPLDGGGVRARERADYRVTFLVGPLRVHEPVRVVEVVERDDRCGFAYATRPGHPVSGEEAFVVHRGPDELVRLTSRSLTGPGDGAWRPVFPVLLVAQAVVRRRYERALLP